MELHHPASPIHHLRNQTTRARIPAQPGVVWWSRLDRRYRVSVTRSSGTATTAVLEITDESTGASIHSQPVRLSTDCRFGPDVADVAAWQSLAISVVDGLRAAESPQRTTT